MTERSSTERTTTVVVPGGSLFVLDAGTKTDPPIVLLHAGIADLRTWDAFVPLLVEAGYRVIRFDARGFGRSETDDVAYDPTADITAVLDALGVQRAVLIGNSRGGATAFDAAISSPERVVAVIGVGAGLGGFEVDPTPAEVDAFEPIADLETALESASDADRPALADQLADLEVRFWVDGPGQGDRVPPALRDAMRDMDRALFDVGRRFGSPSTLTPPASERLDELRCPVLAVAGALDASEVAATARHLESHAPDARAVILPDVAHMIAMESPETVRDLVTDFLAPLPRWS